MRVDVPSNYLHQEIVSCNMRTYFRSETIISSSPLTGIPSEIVSLSSSKVFLFYHLRNRFRISQLVT